MELVPPPELIKENAIGEGDFCAIGEGMIKGLIRRGLLQPGSRVLDVGCGLGRLARPLVEFLKSGGYEGLDVNQSSINWCLEHYQSYPNFHFTWLNAYSKFYNPGGQLKAAQYRFPFENALFDFVMLTSVFTHMMLKDVEHYLEEIGRVLKPGGQCYATYFLLSEELNKAFSSQPQYSRIEGGYVSDPKVPEKVVFLRELAIKPLYDKNDLIIKSISYGSWSGDKSAGGYQDEIVACKKGSEA